MAQPFVDQHAALDRFALRHIGVDGATLMRAWGFPGADDLAATLIAFKHVLPREEEVAESAAIMADACKRRLARETALDNVE